MPITQINVVVANRTRQMSFQSLADFVAAVILGLTGSVTFPTPPVSLVDLGTHHDTLQDAIDAWGIVGNRGSHAQYVALLSAAQQCIVDMTATAGYVQTTSRTAFPGSISDQTAAVLSAGMRAKNPSNALPTWGAAQNLRQLLKQNLQGSGYILLKWAKPLVLPGAESKPPAYNVYSAATPTDPFLFIATVSTTSYLDTLAGLGVQKYYTIRAVGASGLGVETAAILGIGQ